MSSSNDNDWHVSLHFFDQSQSHELSTVHWRQQGFAAVRITAEQIREPFPATFDDFIQSVNLMSGGYAEGDGSYGVVGQGGSWKICGNIYENLDAIQYVELLGQCPKAELSQFVALLGCHPEQCLFQNLQGGFFQSFDQFVTANQLSG